METSLLNNSKTSDINKTFIVLQGYDRKYLSEKQTEDLLGINFKTGEINDCGTLGLIPKDDLIQILFQIGDKGLIGDKILTKMIFGVEKETK